MLRHLLSFSLKILRFAQDEEITVTLRRQPKDLYIFETADLEFFHNIIRVLLAGGSVASSGHHIPAFCGAVVDGLI